MKLLFLLFNKIKNIFRIVSTAGGGSLFCLFVRGSRFADKGNYKNAVNCFQTGLDYLDRTDSRRFFKLRQLWQFNLERSYYFMGNKRAADPLFSCEAVVPNKSDGVSGNKKNPGVFQVEFTHLGLRIDGLSYRKDIEYVDVRINNRDLRRIRLVRKPVIPGFFYFHVQREVLSCFPIESELQIVSPTGEFFTVKGCDRIKLLVPHGENELFSKLDEGAKVDKKGFFSPTRNEVEERQGKYLEIYKSAADFFDNSFKNPLFLMYGTLLGFFRNGDYIPGDDDFDGGYFSYKTNVEDVKEETKKLVVELVLNGFVCSFNRSGRLFRLRRPEDEPGIHLDLRPVWFEDGKIWAHKQACLPLKQDDFVPVLKGTLRNTEISYPCSTEAFLEAYYGRGWKVPDPGYSNASNRVPGNVLRKLKSVCILPADFREMSEWIESRRSDFPNAGRLVSVGSHSLYPLDEYESVCGW